MKNGEAFIPGEPVPGMPDDLAEAIDGYSNEIRERMLNSWQSIGDDG